MENSPVNQSSQGPIQRTGATHQRAPRPSGELKENRSPAFQVLLDRLQERARELEETRKTVDDPAQLAGAVDSARASLADALSLGEELLEAYRQAQSQTPPRDAHDTGGNEDQGGRS